MQLCYRGVHYDYQPLVVEMVDDGDLVGRYRGRPLIIHQAHAAFHRHFAAMYRGISYQY